MPLQVDQVLLGKYRIDRVLDASGSGYVYEATELRLSRKVAIKELRAELVSDARTLDRFLNGAKAIAALNSPRIVTMLGLEDEGEHHYLILEFMDGGSLTRLLNERGKLNPNEAAHIAQLVCEALAVAHRAGLTHCNLKPTNILLSKDGSTVKISDFTFERATTELDMQQAPTQVATPGESPAYASPEQTLGNDMDARSDLYSVGALLYQMVTGSQYLDFTGNVLDDLKKLQSAQPRPLPKGVPPPLEQIITKSLAKDPANRYQTAEAMAAALKALAAPDQSTLRVDTDQMQAHPLPKWVIPVALGAVALVALVAILLVGSNMRVAEVTLTATPTTQLVIAILPTAGPTSTPRPTLDETVVFATALAYAQATQGAGNAIATRVAGTQTASVPTVTRTATPSATPTSTSTSTPTPTSTPTVPPPRQYTALRLVGPKSGELFKEEKQAPFLEWRGGVVGPLADNEYYRIQVYHAGQMNCNIYWKDTSYQLPPSGEAGDGCNPTIWRYNTGDYNWRVSLVIRVDNNVNNDKEMSNSEGWLFRWQK